MRILKLRVIKLLINLISTFNRMKGNQSCVVVKDKRKISKGLNFSECISFHHQLNTKRLWTNLKTRDLHERWWAFKESEINDLVFVCRLQSKVFVCFHHKLLQISSDHRALHHFAKCWQMFSYYKEIFWR